jgi:hypothetical protein
MAAPPVKAYAAFARILSYAKLVGKVVEVLAHDVERSSRSGLPGPASPGRAQASGQPTGRRRIASAMLTTGIPAAVYALMQAT